MARKNKNARPQYLTIPKGTHLMYSPDELYQEPSVVRCMGEQRDDEILVFVPEGFPMWVHVTHVWRSKNKSAPALV